MIVDTDIVIWYMRDLPKAVKLLDTRKGFCISVVTYMELLQGLRNKTELKAFKTALRLWETKVILIDESISQRAMFFVEKFFLSHSLQLADALIAATAIEKQLPLHTGNSRHYRQLKKLDIKPFRP